MYHVTYFSMCYLLAYFLILMCYLLYYLSFQNYSYLTTVCYLPTCLPTTLLPIITAVGFTLPYSTLITNYPVGVTNHYLPSLN